MADNYPRTRQGLERARFSLLQRHATCKGCDAPIEWWKTPTGKKIPMTAKLVNGPLDELVMHMEVCPNRGEFRGAASGPNARPPLKYTNEEAVRNMRDRTGARVVVLVDDNGCTAAWRDGLPGEDLRHDLISAGNFVRAEVNKGEEAKRG